MLKKKVLLFLFIFSHLEPIHGASSSSTSTPRTPRISPRKEALLSEITPENILEKTYEYLQLILFSSNNKMDLAGKFAAGKNSPRREGDIKSSPRGLENFKNLVEPSLKPIKSLIAGLLNQEAPEYVLIRNLNTIQASQSATKYFFRRFYVTSHLRKVLIDVFKDKVTPDSLEVLINNICSGQAQLLLGHLFIYFLQHHVNSAHASDSYLETLQNTKTSNQRLLNDCAKLFGLQRTKITEESSPKQASSPKLSKSKSEGTLLTIFDGDFDDSDSDSDSDEDDTPLPPTTQEPRSLRTQRLSFLGTRSRRLDSLVEPGSPSIAGSPNELAQELRTQLNLHKHSLFSSSDDDQTDHSS
ncbi:hypothetical protein K2W90_00435 [Candidatus Babeliales bacterium]|nr:hypothetical protein [Candidatus Babeliales bacterium]